MKKLLAAVLAATIVSGSAIGTGAVVFEEPVADSEYIVTSKAPNSSNEPTTAELEQMIKLVKPKLDVPEDCTEFDWNYNAATYYNQASWRMTWYNKDYSKEVNVSCDSKGNILSYNLYSYSSGRTIKLPVYSKKELEGTAVEFLNKLAPHAAESMKLESSNAQSLYSARYNYYFVRYENGVIVPDNTCQVAVDYITGEPVSFNMSYNNYVTFEDEATISADEAKAKLTENQKMNLSYRLKTEYDDEGNYIGRKAYLIYQPEVSYLSVDAKTGEVYTQRNTWNVLEKGSAGGGTNGIFGATSDSAMKEEAVETEEYRLSEEELAQLEVLENLITREAAVKAVTENKYLYIDKDATAVEAQLNQIYDYDYYRPAENNADRDTDLYQWSITLTAPYLANEENAYYRPFIRATVDAQTGELISFNASLPGHDYYEATSTPLPEPTITKEQAGTLFNEFASTVVPDYVKNTRLNITGDSYVYKYVTENDKTIPYYRGTNIELVRVNEGVDFTYNSINGAVDLASGKVIRFNYNWYDDVVFESPKDAISPEEAYKALLDSDGFGLNYEINSNYTYHKYLEDEKNGYIDFDKLYTSEQYTRLVYSGYNYLSTTVSALTGELINYSGEPVTRQTEPEYTDVSGHWAQDAIRTLTDLGFAFGGNEFKPDSFITLGEYEKLMQFFGKYINDTVNEDSDRTSLITRTDAVKHIIDAQGYYKVASMPDIFITDFADNSELKREDVGFVAIARGFGFVQGNMGEFRPYDNTTRAEAVTMIFNFIEKTH